MCCAGAIPHRRPHRGRSPPIPTNLGAEAGLLATQYTWGGTLRYRFHLHCLVRGMATHPVGSQIVRAGDRWTACRPRFLLPVRILSRRFLTLSLYRLSRAVIIP